MIPQVRMSRSAADLGGTKIQERGVEVLKVTPQERVSERMGEELVAVEHIILPELWNRAGGKLTSEAVSLLICPRRRTVVVRMPRSQL